jgi:hypothetical protein
MKFVSPVAPSLQWSVRYLRSPSISDTVTGSLLRLPSAGWWCLSSLLEEIHGFDSSKSDAVLIHHIQYPMRRTNNKTFHKTFTIHHASHIHCQSTDYTDIPEDMNIILYHFPLMHVIAWNIKVTCRKCIDGWSLVQLFITLLICDTIVTLVFKLHWI